MMQKFAYNLTEM